MLKLPKTLRIGLLLYILIISTYLGISISTIDHWRQNNIANSPIVYITRTGEKYHRAYHYYGRNSAISLFEADEKEYNPCGVCHPPFAPVYPDKPGFYFYNWFLMSVGISIVYWTFILKKI